MEEIDPRHLLIKIAEILKRLHIPYAITGGMAVFVWARPRFTADIDIVVLLKARDIPRLAGALRKLGKTGYIDDHMMRKALERHGEFNFIDGITGVKVDFWPLKNQPFDKSKIKRRIGKEILGHQVYFVSPEDLILSKLLWYQEGESAKQQEDIVSILNIQEHLDLDYLKQWAQDHNTFTLLEVLWNKHHKKNSV